MSSEVRIMELDTKYSHIPQTWGGSERTAQLNAELWPNVIFFFAEVTIGEVEV